LSQCHANTTGQGFDPSYELGTITRNDRVCDPDAKSTLSDVSFVAPWTSVGHVPFEYDGNGGGAGRTIGGLGGSMLVDGGAGASIEAGGACVAGATSVAGASLLLDAPPQEASASRREPIPFLIETPHTPAFQRRKRDRFDHG